MYRLIKRFLVKAQKSPPVTIYLVHEQFFFKQQQQLRRSRCVQIFIFFLQSIVTIRIDYLYSSTSKVTTTPLGKAALYDEVILLLLYYVCFVFSSHLFWTSSSLDVPTGVTQEEGHTGFFIHLPSAVHSFIFLARRIQSFLSLVDREVEILTI